jgi:hypothetical protein
MSTPSVSHWTCAVPKGGADAADYEDAAALESDDWPVCAAVADGATESVFARAWAKRLVRGLTDQTVTSAEAFGDRLREWQAEWQAHVSERAADRPWYVAAKAAEGAFAAVLGLSLHADGRWRAVAVGDCCLFHVRDGALVQSWPFASPDAFTNRPALVPSRSDPAVPLPETTSGSWHPNDRFVLATDAGAAWLLRGGLDPLRGGLEAVPDWVQAARADGALRNDDVTFLVLDLASAPEADDAASTGS